jgi:hypothetical protein
MFTKSKLLKAQIPGLKLEERLRFGDGFQTSYSYLTRLARLGSTCHSSPAIGNCAAADIYEKRLCVSVMMGIEG